MTDTLADIPEEIVLYAILPLLQCYELDVFSVTSKQNRKRVDKVMYLLFKQRLDQCLLSYVPDLTIKDVLEANKQLYDTGNNIGSEPCISGKILTEVYLGRKVESGSWHFMNRNQHLYLLHSTEQPDMKHESAWQRNQTESVSFNKHLHEFISTSRDLHPSLRALILIGNDWRYPISVMSWVAKHRNSDKKIFIKSEVRFGVPNYRNNLYYLDGEHYYDIRVAPYIYRGTLVVPGWIKSLYFPGTT